MQCLKPQGENQLSGPESKHWSSVYIVVRAEW